MHVSWRLTAIVVLLLPLVVQAQMNSTNYTVPGDAFGGGGSYSSSTNYQAIDTITESATPPEQGMSSTNYIACAGFECVASGGTSLTARITTSSSACTSSTTQASSPMSQPLGTLSTGSVATATNRLCVIVSSSGVTSVAVTVKDAGAGLKSTSVPADTISSAAATLVPGTAGYGVCASNAISGFSKVSPYNGACDTSSGHVIGALATSPASIFSTSGNVTNAVGEILTKAAISTTTPAHADYADTITVIVTGTF